MSYDELKAALRETLHTKGVLSEMRARMHAEVFGVLDTQDEVRPPLCGENLLINEAIREYFEFAGYRHALAVFVAEASQPKERLPREFVSQQLGLDPPTPHVGAGEQHELPLLYSLFARNATKEGEPCASALDLHSAHPAPGAATACDATAPCDATAAPSDGVRDAADGVVTTEREPARGGSQQPRGAVDHSQGGVHLPRGGMEQPRRGLQPTPIVFSR